MRSASRTTSLLRWQIAVPTPLLLSVISVVGSGCQTPPLRTISEEELLERHEKFLSSYESDLEIMAARSLARIEAEYRSSIESPTDNSQSFDVLILSGGGAFGAFGAGLLQGWGQVTEPRFERPQFDQVSGISTGALIAPFAFLGTSEAYDTIVGLYESPGHDWVRKRGIIPYLPGNVSLFDVSKLHERIRSTITPELIQAIGREATEDRQLQVGATNVDYGLLRVWDLARIAHESPPHEALERIVSILLASAAIPGLFPPIVLDDYLYVDGGAAMQIVAGIGDREWVYSPDENPFVLVEGGPPVKLRVWIIINQKLLPDPRVVRSRWTSIALRSLSTVTRTSTLQSIQDAETYVRLMDKHPDFEAEMRYVAIPQNFSIPDSDEMFDTETMRALVDLGRAMGADPKSWRTKALRPGAPFQFAE